MKFFFDVATNSTASPPPHSSDATMFPEWFEASRSLKVAISLTAVIFVVVNVSFFSPYWLQSFPDERLPNPKFTNLGKAYLLIKTVNSY